MHHTTLFRSNCLEHDDDLNEEVSQWWKAETITLESKSNSNDPEVLLANKISKTTCVRQTDGRHKTGLLWKDNSNLPDNRSQALADLNHLVNRLPKKPEQYKKYNEGIQAELEKATLHKYLSINRKIQDGTYHTVALSAQTNPTRYGESAIPKHHKADQASMTNS